MSWSEFLMTPSVLQASGVAAMIAVVGIGWQLRAQRQQRAHQMRREIYWPIIEGLLRQGIEELSKALQEQNIQMPQSQLNSLFVESLPLMRAHLVASPATINSFMVYGRNRLKIMSSASPGYRMEKGRAEALRTLFAFSKMQVPILLRARIDLGFSRLGLPLLWWHWHRHFAEMQHWLDAVSNHDTSSTTN